MLHLPNPAFSTFPLISMKADGVQSQLVVSVWFSL